MTKHSHYHKDVSHLKTIDVYRLLELFGVTDQALGHAIKKLLCAGQRGAGKTFEQDVREAVDTLNRRLQMLAEDGGLQVSGDGRGPNEWRSWNGRAEMPVPRGSKIDIRDHDGQEWLGVKAGDVSNEPRHWYYGEPNPSSIEAWRYSAE